MAISAAAWPSSPAEGSTRSYAHMEATTRSRRSSSSSVCVQPSQHPRARRLGYAYSSYQCCQASAYIIPFLAENVPIEPRFEMQSA
jgi:hypothetical protein